MSWQILLTISILCLSVNGLLHKSLLKDDNSDPRAQTVIFLGMGGLLSIFIALLRGPLELSFPLSLSINLLAIASFGTLAYVLKYRGYQLITASEVVIFATTSKLWNVIGAYFFLHESVTGLKILGTIIILAGVAITIYADKKFKVNKGILIVLASALLFGLTDINGYYILQNMDASSYQIYFYLLPVLALLLIQPTVVKKLSYYLDRSRALKVTALSVFDVLGMLTLFLAYQAGGKASIIGPLSATKIIITVVLAAIFLKERERITNKLIGSIVTVAGVMLLL